MALDDEDLLGYIPDDAIEENEDIPSLTYSLDLRDGRIGKRIDGIDSVKQAIDKALITPRYKCSIYSHEYGSEIQEEATDSPSEGYIVTVLPELIKEALSPDERILDVGNFDISKKDNNVHLEFIAYTIFGEVKIEEVI